MPDTKDVSPFQKALSDPVFYEKYPVGEQRKILGAYDPEFGQLPEKEQNKVIGKYHLSFLQSPTYKKYEAQKSAGKNTVGEFFGTVGKDLLNVPMGVARTESNLLRDPVGTLKGMVVTPQVEQAKQAKKSYQEGNMQEAAGHGLAAAVPIVGPPAAEAGQELAHGDYARGAAHATELLVPDVLGASGALDAGIRGVTKAASKGLRTSAEHEYAEVLHPSPKADKFITQEKLLNPQGKNLLDKKLTGWTAKGLTKKIKSNLKFSSQELDAAYEALPPSHQIKIQPILQGIQDQAMKDATAEVGAGQLPSQGMGNRRIINPKLYAEYQDMALDIIDRLGSVSGDVSPKSLRMLRQDLDSVVSGTFQGKPIRTVNEKVISNSVKAIREELNSQTPSVKKLNAEVSFWMNAKQVMTNTVLRKTGQRKFMRAVGRIGTDAAMAAAGYKEGGFTGAIIAPVVSDYFMSKMQAVFDSTAWHTVSAVTKNEISKALANGNTERALQIGTRAIAKRAQASLPTTEKQAEQRYK